MNVQPLELSYFVDRLQAFRPASIARYGDGEFLAILGVQGENCDHSEYFSDLGAALRESLEHPRAYLHCLAPKVIHRKNGLTEAAFNWIQIHAPLVEWYDSEVFLSASLAGGLQPFVRALADKRVMVVGSRHLRTLPFKPEVFIEVPAVNAWLEYSRIKAAIQQAIYRTNVVLFCAGMTSKVLIYDLFPACGHNRFLFDLGSCFDMYCGVNSRSYARRLPPGEIARLKTLNF